MDTMSKVSYECTSPKEIRVIDCSSVLHSAHVSKHVKACRFVVLLPIKKLVAFLESAPNFTFPAAGTGKSEKNEIP